MRPGPRASWLHQIEDLPGDRREIVLARSLDENLLERSRLLTAELLHVVLRGDPSPGQDHDARTELLDHVEAVRAEEHHAVARSKHAEQRSKEQAGSHVEPGERLVEHE